MDLDQLKLKTSPELNSQERDFIKQNVDKLNDEDKEAYADFLNVEPQALEAPATPAPEVTPAPETPQAPEQPSAFSFKSEDEAKEWVRKQNEENEKAKQAAIDAARTPEQKKYVEDTWKPQDWNDGLRKTVEIVKAELKAEADKKAEQDAVKFWDDQWKELSKEKNLKPLTTEEGRIVHNQIINLMRGYQKASFKEGYELWEKVQGTISGTPVVTPSEAGAALAKAKIDAQKKAATKVGAANPGETKPGNTTGVKPFASYEEMKKSSSRGILRDL